MTILYLINHVSWFDDNSIKREVYFCLIEEKSLYIIRASTNTNLKKRLGNTTKRKIKAIIWNHIRGRGIIDDGLTCIEIGWDDSLLMTKSIKEILVDYTYSNFFFFNYYITRNSWGIRRLD